MTNENAKLNPALNIYELTKQTHTDAYKQLLELRECVIAQDFTQGQLVDIAFMMREISKLADDLRKEADRLQNLAGNVCCSAWLTQAMVNPDISEDVRGLFAKGTPDMQLQSTPPKMKTHPVEYTQMLLDLGVPVEIIDKDLLHIHYPTYCEYITALAQEGMPMPKGALLDKTDKKYVLKLRKTRQTDIDAFIKNGR